MLHLNNFTLFHQLVSSSSRRHRTLERSSTIAEDSQTAGQQKVQIDARPHAIDSGVCGERHSNLAGTAWHGEPLARHYSVDQLTLKAFQRSFRGPLFPRGERKTPTRAWMTT